MVQLIQDKRREIERLCARYHVRRLELFGSAAAQRLDSQPGDVDFLVEFLPLKSGEHADAYFGLLDGLRELLGHPVDLVMTGAIKNPYFLQAIEVSRVVLYAA